jgi:hypothetical protein
LTDVEGSRLALMDYRQMLGLVAGVAVTIPTAIILKRLYPRYKVARIVLTLAVGMGLTVAVVVLITTR